MFCRITNCFRRNTVITGIFCWQEHMISWVWITTLPNWEKMELKGEFLRRAETWARSYQKIRTGPSLLLHGSEYVHFRTFVYIPTFTYLFLLPNSHFLPINHIQCLSFFTIFIFRLSVHCTSKQHSHWRANSPSVSTKISSTSRIHKSLLQSPYHEPDKFCQHAHVLQPQDSF